MIETTVLSSLIHNEEYARKTIPFIKPDYFDDFDERLVFNEIKTYIDEYNALPTKEALRIAIGERSDINEDRFKNLSGIVSNLNYEENTNLEWLVDKTEKFC